MVSVELVFVKVMSHGRGVGCYRYQDTLSRFVDALWVFRAAMISFAEVEQAILVNHVSNTQNVLEFVLSPSDVVPSLLHGVASNLAPKRNIQGRLANQRERRSGGSKKKLLSACQFAACWS